jgi:hypothetical protein
MMKSLLPLPEKQVVEYESQLRCESKAVPGVTFIIRRMSFGARMELSRKIRELSKRVEFLSAGNDVQQHLEANVLSHEIDDVFLGWGLVEIEGMTIDGVAATPALLAVKGPDSLAREIVESIRGQCGLSEEERKN